MFELQMRQPPTAADPQYRQVLHYCPSQFRKQPSSYLVRLMQDVLKAANVVVSGPYTGVQLLLGRAGSWVTFTLRKVTLYLPISRVLIANGCQLLQHCRTTLHDRQCMPIRCLFLPAKNRSRAGADRTLNSKQVTSPSREGGCESCRRI